MDLTGRTFGHLRIDALIGRGGMGAVYRGFDLRLKRAVAVKALRRKGRETPAGRARFAREARLLSRLNHPGVCRVHELIEHPETDLLVLELITGQNLSEIDTEQLSFEKRLVLARDIADALAAAHRQLILHRDLKPDNVMVTDEGQVKLVDFGIARPLEISDSSPPRQPAGVDRQAVSGPADSLETHPMGLSDQELTQMATSFAGLGDGTRGSREGSPSASDMESTDGGETFHTVRGVTLGTMAYMSPEQALGRELGVSSDLYALGIILQELFTGVRAYPRMPMTKLFQRVARAHTEPLDGLDQKLAGLIGELEHVDPEERPSAEETRDRLQRLIDRPYRRRRRRQRWAAAAAAVALVVGAVSAVVYSHFESRRQAALADRFAQEASAIEWLMRAEYLSPAHSVAPARQRVIAQLASLEVRLDDAGPVGRGAGSYALGRAFLALDDLEAAEQRLSAAWESGYRLPEVASYLGLTRVELYREQASKVRRTVDDSARDEQLEALDLELRQPGLELLKTGRFVEAQQTSRPVLSIEPFYYPRALVAFEENRLEQALDLARQASEVWPWFYEADLLGSQIHRQRAAEAGARGDYREVAIELQAARELADEARRVARSDPQAALAACEVENDAFDLLFQSLSYDELAAAFARGDSACRMALDLHDEHVRALSVMASLYQRSIEYGGSGMEEEDPRPRLEQAAQIARRATDLDPTDGAGWKALGDIYSMVADWELFRGYDPRPAVLEMGAAYSQAVELEPNRGRYLKALGNALSLRAEIDMMRGGDPRREMQRAVALYQRASQQRASQVSSHGGSELINLAISVEVLHRFFWALGADPAESVAVARDAVERTISINSNAYRSWRELAKLELWAARRAARLGEAPEAHLAAARAALDKAMELDPDDLHSLEVDGDIQLQTMWHELHLDRDPSTARDRLERIAKEILGFEPQWLATRLGRAASARFQAAYLLDQRTASDRTLDRSPESKTLARTLIDVGYDDVERALDAAPTSVVARLEEGRLAMVDAALAVSFADSARARRASARAERAFEAVIDAWPQRPDGYWAMSALLFQRAEVQSDGARGSGGDEAVRRRAKEMEQRGLDLWGQLFDQPPSDIVLAMTQPQTQRRWLP